MSSFVAILSWVAVVIPDTEPGIDWLDGLLLLNAVLWTIRAVVESNRQPEQ